MTQFLSFILGLVIGVGVVWFFVRGRGKSPNARAMAQKQENLEKVLAMVRAKGQITNDDVEQGLGVSDATAERYLQELENQGKLVQVGSRGRGITYRLS